MTVTDGSVSVNVRVARYVTNVLAILLVVFGLCGVFPVATWLSVPLATADALRRADAIVVLGGGVDDEQTVSPGTAYRLLYGLRLFKQGYAPILILTGGDPDNLRVPESEVMAGVARDFGVPPASLLVERESTRTVTQAQAVARIGRERGMRSILLVTSIQHSYRATRVFRRTGLEVISAPVVTRRQAPGITITPHAVFSQSCGLGPALYEYGALVFYWWRGWM